MDIKRGDIYYIDKYPTIGSEQQAGRPAIIVSNEKNNQHSSTVEVVYLTTQPKADLPTHVTISSAPRESIALCEQVTSVSVDRIGDKMGRLSDREMTQVDIALLVSLDLTMGETGKTAGGHSKPDKKVDTHQPDGGVIIALTAERDTYRAMCESLLERVLRGVKA